MPETSRLHKTADEGPPVTDALLHHVVDALDEIAAETGRTVAQVALNWLLRRPTVANVIVGPRNATQLRDLSMLVRVLEAAERGNGPRTWRYRS